MYEMMTVDTVHQELIRYGAENGADADGYGDDSSRLSMSVPDDTNEDLLLVPTEKNDRKRCRSWHKSWSKSIVSPMPV